MLHGGALEILPIMLALCSMPFHAHYAQNYAGIIGASLMVKVDMHRHTYSYTLFKESLNVF